jgi:peptidoglycan/xylan/chitin deacetylase (PgdA/CDA1 family)
VKVLILTLLRAVGAFALARWITRAGLRILCYHGISSGDEHAFNPTLFMRESVFRRRLQILKERGYPVISLEQAAAGRYPSNAVVITIDDGWVSTLERLAPALHEMGFPSTLYVCTYYCEHRFPVFNVYCRYVFSKDVQPFDLPEFSFYWLSERLTRQAAMERLLVLGETLSFDGRARLATSLGEAARMGAGTQFHYVSIDDLRALQAFGVDIQLHTHRHLFPADDAQAMRREIRDNRAACRTVVEDVQRHFCYPSGEWAEGCFDVLAEQGIETATTCENRLTYADTCRFAVGRFVDSDNTPEVVFEAELSGLLDILRNPRRYLRWRPLATFKALDATPVACERRQLT